MNNIRKKINDKIKNDKGFTLTEMLATVLIMSLVMVVVANGMSKVKGIYDKTIEKSDSQMLLSMMEERIRDELEFVSEVKNDSGVWYHKKSGERYWETITTDGIIKYYDDKNGAIGDWKYDEPLVVNDKRIEQLEGSFESLSFSNGVFEVKGLKVANPNLSDSNLAGGVDLEISTVNDVK